MVAIRNKRILFMYSGQGSHYYQMGLDLYNKDDVFRKSMDQCSTLLKDELEHPLIEVIYNEMHKGKIFDDILYTHPAIFSIEYSLTQLMYSRGIYPHGLLGYSLGEYVAAVVSGVFSLEDGLRIIVQQAKALRETCLHGGMLAFLDTLSVMQDFPHVFTGCTVAGMNYERSFILSGLLPALKKIKEHPEMKKRVMHTLPVQYAFHSEWIEPIQDILKHSLAKISFQSPRLPIYSCVKAAILTQPTEQYFWEVLREEIRFQELIEHLHTQEQEEFIFIDLSPTGTLAGFIKYGFGGKLRSFITINQFGQNMKTIDILLSEYEKLLDL